MPARAPGARAHVQIPGPLHADEVIKKNHTSFAVQLFADFGTDSCLLPDPAASALMAHATDLNETVHFPSMRRLHLWGSKTLKGYAAPPRVRTPRTVDADDDALQRTISLSFPLSSQADNVIKPPSVWSHRLPDQRVMSHLVGVPADSPRLKPYDRTCHQPPTNTARPTVYSVDYCRPATERTLGLPPIHRRVPVPEQELRPRRWLDDADSMSTVRAARFGLTASADHDDTSGSWDLPSQLGASLDPPYHPSNHGVRSIIRAKTWLRRA